MDRVIFVAPGTGGLSASLGAVTTTSGGTGNGISWAVADAPPAGTWTLSTPGMAIVDLSLFLTSSVEPTGVGQPVKVRVHLCFNGQPVSGATIQVRVLRPGGAPSPPRPLLDANQAGHHECLEKTCEDLTLTEAVPGVYEGALEAAFTQAGGLYTFDFHAEGNTPSGARFVRDQSRCAMFVPSHA